MLCFMLLGNLARFPGRYHACQELCQDANAGLNQLSDAAKAVRLVILMNFTVSAPKSKLFADRDWNPESECHFCNSPPT